MGTTYLNKFNSTVPTIQGQQVLSILQDKKNTGEIKTIAEFEANLQSLTQTLLAQQIEPTLKVFRALAGATISSETYNWMLQRIEDDLHTAFTEINNIELILESHKEIINEIVLKAIQLGINELDARISLYESINLDKLGLHQGITNTFNTSLSAPTIRTDKLGSILFANVDTDAVVDTAGGHLNLGYTDFTTVVINSARLVNDIETTSSELDVSYKGSSISNLFDNDTGTYYIHNVLLSSPRRSGVISKIELDLAGIQDINFIEISPATPQSMELVGLRYSSNNGSVGVISITPTLLSKTVRFSFPRITADKLTVIVRQANYTETQFIKGAIDTSFTDALTGNNITSDKTINPIATQLNDLIRSTYISNTILSTSSVLDKKFNKRYYQYLFGFDNISLGLENYEEVGIYVSKPITISNAGQLVLKTVESRPGEKEGSFSIDETIDSTKYYHSSLEYEIVSENFDTRGNFIGLDRYPILPINTSKIIHERIEFTSTVLGASSPNVGIFRFFPVASSIHIFRNGTEIIQGVDWSITDPAITAFLQNDPTAVSRMVQPVVVYAPRTGDIFTVTYQQDVSNSLHLPTVVNTLTHIVSLAPFGYVRFLDGNIVATDTNRGSDIIAKSNIYLIIVIRRNSGHTFFSAEVKEYSLLVGSEDLTRFVDVLI